MSSFPRIRPRRLRRTEAIRNQMAETRLNLADFMYPIFVAHGKNIKSEIQAMPGQFHWSLDRLPELLEQISQAGILSVMVFGVPATKDHYGTENYADNGIVQQSICCIKKLKPNLIVAADVCLCAYTTDGHCGLFYNNEIDNDQTLSILQKTAISYANNGVDIVAPSGMIDGMVHAIRYALDQNNFTTVAIMSYAVKYASSFYGPFRDASATLLKGDRKSHQMDYRNKKEALKEALIDQDEGADFLMVKPAMSYLDIIQDINQHTTLPIAAYQVSGEYAMIKAASEKGWVNEAAATIESLTAIKRAGAKIIITYYALMMKNWLAEIEPSTFAPK